MITIMTEEGPITVDTEYVNPKDVLCDTIYQRVSTERRVDMISREWDILLSKFTLVNESEDGKLYCIDGAHRVKAALKAGVKQIPANVYRGLSLRLQAKLFDSQRKTKNLMATEAYKAGLIAGEPDCIWVQNFLAKYSRWIDADDYSDKHFSAIAGLRQWYARKYTDLVERAFDLIVETWQFAGQTKHRNFIEAVLWVCTEIDRGNIDRREFVEKLSLIQPSQITSEANSIMAAGEHNKTASIIIAILKHYNFRKSRSRVEYLKHSERMYIIGKRGGKK